MSAPTICRNIPDDAWLRTERSHNPNHLEMDMSGLTSTMMDRDTILMATDPTKLREAQHVDFEPYFKYLTDDNGPLSPGEFVSSTLHHFIHDNLRYRSYPSGHLGERTRFRNQLVVPPAIIKQLVLHTCHDHALSGGHFPFKPTFEDKGPILVVESSSRRPKRGAETAKLVSDVKGRTTDLAPQ